MMKYMFCIMCFFTFTHAITVSDIEEGYEKIGDSLDDFKEEVKKLKKKYKIIEKIVESEKLRVQEDEAMIKTTSDTFVKMGDESSIFVRAELLRGESSYLKNKEILYGVWKLSQEISKEDISLLRKK